MTRRDCPDRLERVEGQAGGRGVCDHPGFAHALDEARGDQQGDAGATALNTDPTPKIA